MVVNHNDDIERPVPRYAILIMSTFFVVTLFLIIGHMATKLKAQSAARHEYAADSIGVYIPVALVTLYTGCFLVALIIVLLAERLADMWHQGGTSEQIDALERRLLAFVYDSVWHVVGYVIIGVPVGILLWWMFILL